MTTVINGLAPDSPHVITASAPGGPTRNWEATDNKTVSGWVSVESGSGPCDSKGQMTGSFPDGPGTWEQT